MKFVITKSSAESFETDIVVIGLYEMPELEADDKITHALIKHVDGGIALDKALKGELSRQIASERFTGARGTSRLLFTAGRIPARFVLLVGLGKLSECNLDVLREVGATIAKAAADIGAATAALVLERGLVEEQSAPERARAIAEGVLLGAYRFDRYKSEKETKAHALATAYFLYQGDAAPVRAEIENGRIVAEAQNLARDLVNTPALDATPRALAHRARQIAQEYGLKCRLLGPDAIEEEKMGGLIAVSRGSAEPPEFIELSYKPKERPSGHLALVGKGITFDSGGISLKPPRGMEVMKSDMAGAAAVLFAMQVIAQLKPRVQVSAFIPASENLPDGKAIKPGDIIKMRNGKTVEIISTDCEGRMVLADALSYAADRNPDAIVDIATLTGGAAYCCGELYTMAMGNEQKLVDRLVRAAGAAGEPMWPLPMVEAYKKGYTSGIADLNNTGKSKAQTILGAIFLREFVGKAPWAHLDIAASSWTEDDLPIGPKGATGIMVRTLVEFVMGFKKNWAD